MNKKSNIVLIGMPGAGKSTIGVILAKLCSLDFLDTDVLIQTTEGRSLQYILDSFGYMALRDIEEKILMNLNCQNHVIATGGSAAYSEAAMNHLREQGRVVFLNVTFDIIQKRVFNFGARGIARRPEQSFLELFEERHPLYEKYADMKIDCQGRSQDKIAMQIAEQLSEIE